MLFSLMISLLFSGHLAHASEVRVRPLGEQETLFSLLRWHHFPFHQSGLLSFSKNGKTLEAIAQRTGVTLSSEAAGEPIYHFKPFPVPTPGAWVDMQPLLKLDEDRIYIEGKERSDEGATQRIGYVLDVWSKAVLHRIELPTSPSCYSLSASAAVVSDGMILTSDCRLISVVDLSSGTVVASHQAPWHFSGDPLILSEGEALFYAGNSSLGTTIDATDLNAIYRIFLNSTTGQWEKQSGQFEMPTSHLKARPSRPIIKINERLIVYPSIPEKSPAGKKHWGDIALDELVRSHDGTISTKRLSRLNAAELLGHKNDFSEGGTTLVFNWAYPLSEKSLMAVIKSHSFFIPKNFRNFYEGVIMDIVDDQLVLRKRFPIRNYPRFMNEVAHKLPDPPGSNFNKCDAPRAVPDPVVLNSNSVAFVAPCSNEVLVVDQEGNEKGSVQLPMDLKVNAIGVAAGSNRLAVVTQDGSDRDDPFTTMWDTVLLDIVIDEELLRH